MLPFSERYETNELRLFDFAKSKLKADMQRFG